MSRCLSPISDISQISLVLPHPNPMTSQRNILFMMLPSELHMHMFVGLLYESSVYHVHVQKNQDTVNI